MTTAIINPASAWEIGVYWVKGNGTSFDIPAAPDKINGIVRKPPQPLLGANGLRARFRITAAPGVAIKPAEAPDWPTATMSLYFQRKEDDWSGEGKYDFFRWWSSREITLTLGEHVFEVPFSERWNGVNTATTETHYSKFLAAQEKCRRVGLVLGGGPISKGHGVIAVGGAARFELLGFDLI